MGDTTQILAQRRASDQPPTVIVKVKDRTLAGAALLGAIGFLYQLSEILMRHAEWSEFQRPAGVGEILFALVCGLTALGAALGLNIESLLKGFQKGTRG